MDRGTRAIAAAARFSPPSSHPVPVVELFTFGGLSRPAALSIIHPTQLGISVVSFTRRHVPWNSGILVRNPNGCATFNHIGNSQEY